MLIPGFRKLYIVYVVWLAIETTVIWFVYPETKGPALEELSRLFEDVDPLVKGQLDLENSTPEKAQVAEIEEAPEKS